MSCEQKLEEIKQSSIRNEALNTRIINALNELIKALGGNQQ